MANETDKREMAISMIADLLREVPFTIEHKVVKKPKGVKVIVEITQEEMDEFMSGVVKK